MYPEKRIMNKVTKEQREKGIKELLIQTENAKFADSMADKYFTTLIQKINKQIGTGIDELGFNNQWPNLKKVAIHALTQAIISVAKFDKNSISKKMQPSFECHLELLKMSIPELNKVCKPEFLEKFKLIRKA